MAYSIDSISYHLGTIFVFSEMVAFDVKKMAFSLPFRPQEHGRLAPGARRVAREQGVRVHLEKKILTTDLFPEDFTRGKWVLILYKDPRVLRSYLRLKSRKERLLKKDQYRGKARIAVAVELGKLLNYKMATIHRMLREGKGEEGEN